MEYHRQCRLSRQVEGKMEIMTTWLPEKFAHIGKVLEIEVSSGVWQNGWSVYEIYSRVRTQDAVQWERDFKRIRGEDI